MKCTGLDRMCSYKICYYLAIQPEAAGQYVRYALTKSGNHSKLIFNSNIFYLRQSIKKNRVYVNYIIYKAIPGVHFFLIILSTFDCL